MAFDRSEISRRHKEPDYVVFSAAEELLGFCSMMPRAETLQSATVEDAILSLIIGDCHLAAFDRRHVRKEEEFWWSLDAASDEFERAAQIFAKFMRSGDGDAFDILYCALALDRKNVALGYKFDAKQITEDELKDELVRLEKKFSYGRVAARAQKFCLSWQRQFNVAEAMCIIGDKAAAYEAAQAAAYMNPRLLDDGGPFITSKWLAVYVAPLKTWLMEQRRIDTEFEPGQN